MVVGPKAQHGGRRTESAREGGDSAVSIVQSAGRHAAAVQGRVWRQARGASDGGVGEAARQPGGQEGRGGRATWHEAGVRVARGVTRERRLPDGVSGDVVRLPSRLWWRSGLVDDGPRPLCQRFEVKNGRTVLRGRLVATQLLGDVRTSRRG